VRLAKLAQHYDLADADGKQFHTANLDRRREVTL
jgi:hypothetical protein